MEFDEKKIMELIENEDADSKKIEKFVSLKLKQIAEEVNNEV